MAELTEVQEKRIDRIEANLKRLLEEFENSPIPEENILDTKRFLKSLAAEGISARRRTKYFYEINKIFQLIPTIPLRFMVRESMEELIIKVRESKAWTDRTKRDYCIMLKKFFRWLDGGDERAKWIKTVRFKAPLITEDKVFTVAEVHKLASCGDFRERAIVEALFNSGATASELCDMNVGDVRIDDAGVLWFHIPGIKNEFRERTIPVSLDAEALKVLKDYFEAHPQKANPAAPLWLGECGLRLHDRSLAKLLKELYGLSGIVGKRCNPHNFRKSKVMELRLKAWGHPLIESYLGWRPGSDVIKDYASRADNSLLQTVLSESSVLKSIQAEKKSKAFLDEIKNNPAKKKAVFEGFLKAGVIDELIVLAGMYSLGNYEKTGDFELKFQAPGENQSSIPKPRRSNRIKGKEGI